MAATIAEAKGNNGSTGEPETKTGESFNSWLSGPHELVEKTFGAVVLAVELFNLFGEIYSQVPKIVLTQLLNLFFLVFIYFYLKEAFSKRFRVDPESADVAERLRFKPGESGTPDAIRRLMTSSNQLISQLSNINKFILFTALLYAFLLLQTGATWLARHSLLAVSSEDITKFFHLIIDALSYGGAFYLLRCFYVMYLTTLEENDDEPILKEETRVYIFVGCLLMAFDCVETFTNNNGIFVSEFICGIINAIVFILLIARFENKMLDIPTWMLCILYVYAVLQTCLPFVTGDFLTNEIAGNESEMSRFLKEFSSIVLTACLIGKIALSAVLLYVISTGRIFYYFMVLKKIHEEEKENWGQFKFAQYKSRGAIESVDIEYSTNEDSCMATLASPFNIICEGGSQEEARESLIRRITNGPHT